MAKRRKKKKPYSGSFYGANAKMVTFGVSIINRPEQEPTLGDASTHVGKVVGTRREGKLLVSRRIEPCTCGWDNENCFKCGGTGYSIHEVVVEAGNQPASPKAASTKHRPLAGFASDSRAGGYSIREQGRFDSRPIHDEFGDESEP